RGTAQGVWACVILSTLAIIVLPWSMSKFPGVATSPALTQMSTKPGVGIYFASVVHERAQDLSSPLRAGPGLNRFNLEAWLLGKAGVDVAGMTPNGRFVTQFMFDGLFPFVVMIVVSFLTKRTDPARVAVFYG